MKLTSVNRFIRLTLLVNILVFIYIYLSRIDLAQWINTGAYPFYYLEDKQVIYVDGTKYDGLSDTKRLDSAIADAAGNGAILVFGSKTYVYQGSKIINHTVNWKGSQTATFNPVETVIQIDGRWTFNGRGTSRLHGIAINANRSFTGDVIRVNERVGSIEFNQCHIMGALHRENSEPAILLNIVGNLESVIFNNGTLFNAHSESSIELASVNGSTSGGWRRWPSVRGFNAIRFDGYLEMKNVEIFNIGHEVRYLNGDKVWENPREERLNPGGWDIDAWQRSGREGSGYTHMENVMFYSSPGSFIKISSHGGTLFFKNIDIHIREGEPIAGRPVRLQSYGSGNQRNGISEENPVYLDDMAIFGYHRTNAPKYGLVIENTRVNVPGGIEWFFRTSSNANYSFDDALKRVNEVTFRNNKDMKYVRRFYYANSYLK